MPKISLLPAGHDAKESFLDDAAPISGSRGGTNERMKEKREKLELRMPDILAYR
jgi:hypothetical protein